MISIIDTIKLVALEAGEIGFRHAYSGRGMYGKTCIAITGDSHDLRLCLAIAMLMMQDDVFQRVLDMSSALDPHVAFDLIIIAQGELQKATETLFNWSEDSMGLRSVFYWPMLEWQGDNTDGEEE